MAAGVGARMGEDRGTGGANGLLLLLEAGFEQVGGLEEGG